MIFSNATCMGLLCCTAAYHPDLQKDPRCQSEKNNVTVEVLHVCAAWQPTGTFLPAEEVMQVPVCQVHAVGVLAGLVQVSARLTFLRPTRRMAEEPDAAGRTAPCISFQRASARILSVFTSSGSCVPLDPTSTIAADLQHLMLNGPVFRACCSSSLRHSWND